MRKEKVRKELGNALRTRKRIKKRKPGFLRQEGYRLARLRKSWRRPKGRHSKLRKGEKARGGVPKAGYGSPKAVRGLTRYGYREVRVSSPKQLDELDPHRDAALISSAVGRKKRTEIVRKAEEMKIFVINRRA
jgi:large subunit ribosomal protein L32e